MRQLNLNKGVALLGLMLLLLLTYFRENFLLEINASLASKDFDRSNTYFLSDFFGNMSKDLLIKWKWGLTAVFSLLISLITILSLYCWFKSVKFFKLISLFYVTLFVIVCLLAFIGFLTSSFNEIYFVLRKIVGVVQSPLPFFAFFTLFYWRSEYS